MVAMASDDDLAARFTSDPGDPVLAAHQLVAELAQLYYERPNDITRPGRHGRRPHRLDRRPGLRRRPARLARRQPGGPGGHHRAAVRPVPDAGDLPVGLPSRAHRHIDTARGRRPRPSGPGWTGSRSPRPGRPPVAQQLGDLVLGGEAEALRTSQQSAVLANAGAAVDAQIGQVAVEGDQSVTLTSSSGRIPITVVSNAPYPCRGHPGAEQRQAPVPQRSDRSGRHPRPSAPALQRVLRQGPGPGVGRVPAGREPPCPGRRPAPGHRRAVGAVDLVVGGRRGPHGRGGVGAGRVVGPHLAAPPGGPTGRGSGRRHADGPDDGAAPVGATSGDAPAAAP